jgi:hypothetical protein
MGELKGHQWQPRELAAWNYAAGWHDAVELVTMTAVDLSESQGYDRAVNTNADGTVDRGVKQLNSSHASATDEIAYDPKASAVWAYANLYKPRRARGQTGFEDWYGYKNGVWLHDSYIGRAAVGVANHLADGLLKRPVPDWEGEPYVHRFETPVADFRFRVGALMASNTRVAAELGWSAATKAKVTEVRGILAAVRSVVHRITPP